MKTLFRFGKATAVLFFSVFVILFKLFFDEPTKGSNDSSENEELPLHDVHGTARYGEHHMSYDDDGNKII